MIVCFFETEKISRAREMTIKVHHTADAIGPPDISVQLAEHRQPLRHDQKLKQIGSRKFYTRRIRDSCALDTSLGKISSPTRDRLK